MSILGTGWLTAECLVVCSYASAPTCQSRRMTVPIFSSYSCTLNAQFIGLLRYANVYLKFSQPGIGYQTNIKSALLLSSERLTVSANNSVLPTCFLDALSYSLWLMLYKHCCAFVWRTGLLVLIQSFLHISCLYYVKSGFIQIYTIFLLISSITSYLVSQFPSNNILSLSLWFQEVGRIPFTSSCSIHRIQLIVNVHVYTYAHEKVSLHCNVQKWTAHKRTLPSYGVPRTANYFSSSVFKPVIESNVYASRHCFHRQISKFHGQ